MRKIFQFWIYQEVPSDILHTTIGVLLRLLYEALFWSRDLSQGEEYIPLLLVMEEAYLFK